ncbi:hypothetical protein RN053_21165 [Pantoea dispersa]|uniref:hypothetical protein n=1 Tax=Pantoea dispersa TaxID=59814 RepID=UPI0028DE5723|nr:hypothetical protein [Pantoea dispersa]MDT8853022.1 hypothetical protein [Pantoea dispersa]
MKNGTTGCNPSTDTGTAPAVKIGEFTISNFGDGLVWVEDGDEDAMAVEESLLIEALRAFYDANF